MMTYTGKQRERISKRGLARLGIRGLMGLVFVFAGAGKLGDIHGFTAVVADFGLLPDALVPSVAVALPVLEIFCGLALVFGMRYSLSAVSALLVIFIAVLGYGMSIGLDTDCGCFGRADTRPAQISMAISLGRDLLMLAACGFLAWSSGWTLSRTCSR